MALWSHSAIAQVGRITGIVKDEYGQPVKGATVTAERSESGQSFTATTDDKGRFIMITLRSGQWQFMAQAPGFLPDGGAMPVRIGGPNAPVTFVLKKGGAANYGPLGGIGGRELQADLAAAETAFAQGRWDEAIDAYRDLMTKSPVLGVINLQIAAANRGKKDYTAALAAYGELLKGDPDNQKALVGVAATHVERGDETAAEATLQQAARSPNAGREVFFILGERRFAKNDMADAANWYRKASAADPSWGKPLYKLGLCSLRSGASDEAATLMAKVIAVDPISAEAGLAKSSLDSLKK